MRAPNCEKPLSDILLVTPLRDKLLYDAEILLVSRLVIFTTMDDQMFVVRWGDSFVDIGRAYFIVLDVLYAVKQSTYKL